MTAYGRMCKVNVKFQPYRVQRSSGMKPCMACLSVMMLCLDETNSHHFAFLHRCFHSSCGFHGNFTAWEATVYTEMESHSMQTSLITCELQGWFPLGSWRMKLLWRKKQKKSAMRSLRWAILIRETFHNFQCLLTWHVLNYLQGQVAKLVWLFTAKELEDCKLNTLLSRLLCISFITDSSVSRQRALPSNVIISWWIIYGLRSSGDIIVD